MQGSWTNEGRQELNECERVRERSMARRSKVEFEFKCLVRQELQISSQTREKAEVAKAFIEDRYAHKKAEEKQRKEAFDNLVQVMSDQGVPLTDQQLVKNQIMHMEAEKKRQQRQKQSVREYEPVKIIGRGAFGEVRLCRIIKTG